jgi:hypothetical protein
MDTARLERVFMGRPAVFRVPASGAKAQMLQAQVSSVKILLELQ